MKETSHIYHSKLRQKEPVTPQSGTPERMDSYVVRARKTLPNTARRGKSSPVSFRESRWEIASGLDLTAVTDLRG